MTPTFPTPDPVFEDHLDFARWWEIEEQRIRREANANAPVPEGRGDTVPSGDVSIDVSEG